MRRSHTYTYTHLTHTLTVRCHTPTTPHRRTYAHGQVPLYVVNYIWDGDELTAADMKKQIETACYSVHAIGLVFDPRGRVAYFADPNGPLIKGGSMEFLCLPFCPFPKRQKPTTALSQWDRDEAKRSKGQPV